MNPINVEDLRYKIGSRVKEIRISKNMTQEDLEEKSCISTRQISDIENGYVDTKSSTLFKMAEAFGLTIYDLLNFDDK